jgi:rhamnogalacturonyl hydrolase YesR
MSDYISDLSADVESTARTGGGVWTLSACGITRTERAIAALVHRDAYRGGVEAARVLLVGGLSGRQQDVGLALRCMHLYAGMARKAHGIALSVVPCANPDGLALGVGPQNGAGGVPEAGYPPVDGFFNDPTDPEKRYLWRWVCHQAPDLVLELCDSDAVVWEANEAAVVMARPLGAAPLGPSDSLLAALGTGEPDGLGTVPGLRLSTPQGRLKAELDRLWSLLRGTGAPGPSAARVTLEARAVRSPVEVGRALAQVYGHTLTPMMYTKGVAVSGRLRLAELDSQGESPLDDIEALVSPFVSDFDSVEANALEQGALSGFVWCDDLAEATGNSRYSDLLVRVADKFEPRGMEGGGPPEAADTLVEDMFHAGVLWGRAFKITGDVSYPDRLARFLLGARNQQDVGYFWHSPSAPHYWGRGNGFAALGFAEALTYVPDDHPRRNDVVAKHRRHLEALRPLQRPSGMFPQLLDSPGSFDEFTATCQIGYAVARGLNRGWLDGSYGDMVERAWRGVSQRIDEEGNVTDACEGTGLMDSRQDYLDRQALSGFDDRSGSMAIWFATEMSGLRAGI